MHVAHRSLPSTQNPMDLEYRALSNAGPSALGTLQADADRVRSKA